MNNELNNNEADSCGKKNKIRAAELPCAKAMSSSQVLKGDEADKALLEAFGENESPLDNALKKSLGLKEDKEMGSKEDKKPVSRLRSVLSFLLTLAICVVLALLFTQFIMQRNTVVGRSMEPTLLEKDELFVEKISHLWDDYARADLITARTDSRTIDDKPMIVIKRIVGLPGETIKITEGKLFVDGAELNEPYLDGIATSTNSPIELTLGEDEYFLLGDNRSDSHDSRHFGPVDGDDLLGKVWFRFYPFDRFGKP